MAQGAWIPERERELKQMMRMRINTHMRWNVREGRSQLEKNGEMKARRPSAAAS